MTIETPSWVIEGTYAENLRFLANTELDGVELLFFMYDAETEALLNAEFDAIRAFASRFTYTVHLPDILEDAHAARVEKLFPLARQFIVHPVKEEDTSREAAVLERFFARFGKDKFLLENTHPGRLETLLSLLKEEENGLCMDTGHLLLQNESPAAYYERFAGRIREIHLHGLDREAARTDGRLPDHRALKAGETWLTTLFSALKQHEYAGVINLEVFSWAEAKQSLEVLEKIGADTRA
jgi:sugar phosphate isomerase/epimerase